MFGDGVRNEVRKENEDKTGDGVRADVSSSCPNPCLG